MRIHNAPLPKVLFTAAGVILVQTEQNLNAPPAHVRVRLLFFVKRISKPPVLGKVVHVQ